MPSNQISQCIEATRYGLKKPIDLELDMMLGSGAIKTPDKFQSDIMIKTIATEMNLILTNMERLTSNKLKQHEIWTVPMLLGK